MVHVNGTLQGVIIGENPAHLFVRAHFTYGSDWTIVAGAEQVLTQVAIHEQPGGAVLNMPIDVCFRTTNLHGWPRIVLSVYGESGLQSLLQSRPVPIPLGHGAALLPVVPGSQIPVSLSP